MESAPMPAAYAELHCHSNFSFLDGVSSPEALIEQAAALGLAGLALTDTNGLYGIVRFAAAAKARAEREGWAPRAIVGAELLLGNHSDTIVLLVENLAGYRNLCWLIERAHRATLNPDDVRAATFHRPAGGGDADAIEAEPFVTLADLHGHTEGLIALARPWEALARRLAALHQLFGADHLFVETQRHLVPGDGEHNATLRRTAQALGLRCVATNDVHYATQEQARLHDVVTAIRHRVSLEEASQPTSHEPPLLRPNYEWRMNSPRRMAALFRDHPEELALTVEIAERCTFSLADLCYEFPRPISLADDDDPYEILVDHVWTNARRYYGRFTSQLQDRIVHELETVRTMKLAGYLLVFKDIVDFCHRERILVSIRGSAPSSVLLYCLGLCPIDPLEHGLL